MIELWFPVPPLAKERPRVSRYGNVYTPAKTAKYESFIRVYGKKFVKEPLEGPLEVEMEFRVKKPKKPTYSYPTKCDLDNYVKSFLDGGNHTLWVSDSQIISLSAEKLYEDSQGPGIRAIIRPYRIYGTDEAIEDC